MAKRPKKAAGAKAVGKKKTKATPIDKDVAGIDEKAVKDSDVKTEAVDDTEITVEKYKELNDKHLRLMAEFDNYRKRTIREKEVILKSAAEDIIKELLPILDNLDRATEHRKNNETLDEYVDGIALIEEQFRRVLSRSGLGVLDVAGKEFDPEIHDAIMQMESKDHKPNMIINEVEKGYVLSGKVIRHPKVVVSK